MSQIPNIANPIQNQQNNLNFNPPIQVPQSEASILNTIEEYKSKEDKMKEKAEERIKTFINEEDSEDVKRKRDQNQDKLRKGQREKYIQSKRDYERKDSGTSEQNLSSKFSEIVFTMKNLPELVKCITSNDEDQIYFGSFGIRKILAIEGASPIQEIIDANIVPRLLELVTCNKPHIQFEAAWCLTNIATGTTEQTQCLTDKGAIPKFVELLKSPLDNIKDQAIWALGNIAGENTIFRNQVLNAGFLDPLLEILYSTNSFSIKKNGTWALSNLCRGKPSPPFQKLSKAIPVLINLIINSEEREILLDSCWTLSYLSDGGENGNKSKEIMNYPKIFKRLVELLSNQNLGIVLPCLRIMGNVITGNDDQTQVVVDAGIVAPLSKLLDNPKPAIRKEAAWSISNITAGNENQISEVIKHGVIQKLIKLVEMDLFDIKRESIWALSNSTSASTLEQTKFLLDSGIISSLCIMLRAQDARTLAITLEGVENLLRKGKESFVNNGINLIAYEFEKLGGLDNIESLQKHQNIHIYKKALKLIEDYYGIDESANLNANPMEKPSIFKF